MFDQTFVDTSAHTRRPWTIALSIAAQTAFVCVILLIPLLHPELLLPRIETPVYMPLQALKRVAPKTVTQPPQQQRAASKVYIAPNPNVAPARIPSRIDMTPDVPTLNAGISLGVISGPTFSDGFAGLPTNIIAEKPRPKPLAQRIEPARPTAPVPIGGAVQASKLIFGPKPAYPALAKAARIQGVVKLRAFISKDGSIRNLQMLSGPPLLVTAALQAVQQWRYSPTLLNNEPVEVITEIDVNFTLSN